MPEKEYANSILMKTTMNFVLPEIVQYIIFNEQASFGDLEWFLKDKVTKPQIHRAVQLLVNLKWLIRREIFTTPRLRRRKKDNLPVGIVLKSLFLKFLVQNTSKTVFESYFWNFFQFPINLL